MILRDMARPWRIRYSGAKYHVTSRGNGRQRIFLEKDDYLRFLEQLGSALEKDEVILYAYVLMPNHYHFFVETPLGNIQRFMQRLNTAYSMYFRYKHSWPGHCLQGRYKAKLVGGDEYVVRVTRYIHLNPVETQAIKRKSLPERKRYLNVYQWSSYPGYVNKAAANEIVDYRWLGMMGRNTSSGNRRAYKAYAEGMIGSKDDLLEEALVGSRYAIGDKEFIEEAEFDLKEMRLRRTCYGDVELPRKEGARIEEIEGAVAKEFKVETRDLHFHGHRLGIAKGVAIELCCELAGKSQREIAKHFGYKTDAGITRQRRVLRDHMAKSPAIERCIMKLKRKLSGTKV